MKEAYESGRHLVGLKRKPFKKMFYEIKKEEERVLAVEQIVSYHFSLPFMNYDWIDEMLLLAEQLMDISKEKGINIEKAKMEYDKAKELISQGRKDESIKHAVKAYIPLYY